MTYVELSDDPLDDDADAKDPDASMSDGGSDEEDSGYSESEDIVKPPAAKKRRITGKGYICWWLVVGMGRS